MKKPTHASIVTFKMEIKVMIIDIKEGYAEICICKEKNVLNHSLKSSGVVNTYTVEVFFKRG